MNKLQTLFLCVFSLALFACQPAHIQKINTIRDLQALRLAQQVEAAHFKLGAPVFIRVFKDENQLELWMQTAYSNRFRLFKTYPICTYSGLLGPKFAEGDYQAPEGFYDIEEDRLWPGSKYHLAMNIGFPNDYDEYHGRTGSNIMIHGDCISEGCFAMTDKIIEEIYLLVEYAIEMGQDSVPVHVFPFRMSDENMALWMGYEWTPFWLNLKQGYDLFEINRIPPQPVVQQGRYTFPDYYIPREKPIDH